ncbi:toll-like receptor 13 [Sitodiplosis mosellana]|uniref:toll-like receptor 13 n=1 Tax=Sitodiplosis mosellana TaxID=263140 RepID=UPI0024447FE5|nr:toll-like receptor 13 [Sitodiplosis mosellana]
MQKQFTTDFYVLQAKIICKMKFLFIFVLICIKVCDSIELKCGYLTNDQKIVEFYCENYQELWPVNCTKSALYSISSCDKSKVTQLKIGGCDQDTISVLIHDFRNIHSLDLSYSDLQSLNPFNETLGQLVKLDLSHNRLTENPREFFTQNPMPRLNEIDLSYNEFSHVSGLPDALKQVNLSYNNLSLINYYELTDVPSLLYLDLAHNFLEKIDHPDIFAKAKHLKTLRLEDNRYREFDGRFLQLIKRGVTVVCSWNYITSFEMDENLGKSIRIITKRQIEGILSTADGKLKFHCHEGSFEAIESFKFTDNHIENISELLRCLTPSLKQLTLSGRFTEKLNVSSVERFENLTKLTLNDGLLTSFDFNSIKTLRNLESLDISRNNLKRIGNLQHNPRSFIYELNLSKNYVGQINASTFEKYKFLRTLNLSNTRLALNDLRPFDSFYRLEKLDISYNNLEKANFTSLPPVLKEMQQFSAAYCNIANVSALLKQFGPNIDFIDLSGNPLQRLENITFENVTRLDMNLSRTHLSHISFAFERLWRIDLSHNNLKSVDLNLTAVRSWLMELRLNGNELTDVDQFAQSKFMDLKLISISNNQFSCKQLAQFINDWPNSKLIDNPLRQKHGDCSHAIRLMNNLGFVGGLIS